MKNLSTLNPENVSDEELKTYPIREAARAVVSDGEGNVALLHVANKNYYKIPGGGIDEGEDHMTALKRECGEEIGCDIEVTGEIGVITEWRRFETLKQISYCYTARVKGDKCEPDFTEEELTDGFEVVWLSYEKALETLRNSQTQTNELEGRDYIVPRDTTFLSLAR